MLSHEHSNRNFECRFFKKAPFSVGHYLETLRKQGVDLLHALVQSFQGETPQPSMG